MRTFSPVVEVPAALVVPPAKQTTPTQVPPASPADPAVPVKPEIVLIPAAESTKILVERLKKLGIVCF